MVIWWDKLWMYIDVVSMIPSYFLMEIGLTFWVGDCCNRQLLLTRGISRALRYGNRERIRQQIAAITINAMKFEKFRCAAIRSGVLWLANHRAMLKCTFHCQRHLWAWTINLRAQNKELSTMHSTLNHKLHEESSCKSYDNHRLEFMWFYVTFQQASWSDDRPSVLIWFCAPLLLHAVNASS